MNCIILDDEPLATRILEDYCKEISYLNVVGVFNNPIEAIKAIETQTIDLVFLDIHMPFINGTDLLRSLNVKPLIIFTTAFTDYALEGYELNVIDYLLKPIPFERMIKACNKALKQYQLLASHTNSKLGYNDYIFVNADYKSIKVNIKDIIYIEGLKDYVKIYTSEPRPILTIMRLKNLESILPSDHFLRVHRSFLINFNSVDFIKKGRIAIGDKEIPIGEMYAETVKSKIESRNF